MWDAKLGRVGGPRSSASCAQRQLTGRSDGRPWNKTQNLMIAEYAVPEKKPQEVQEKEQNKGRQVNNGSS